MLAVRPPIAIFLFLSFFSAGASCAQERTPHLVSFPAHSRATSPDGRFVVLNQDSDVEPHHTLFLEDRKLNTRRTILEYARGVDILWNPDGQSFALTDYGGSDFAVCSIIYVNEKVDPTSVLQGLLKKVSVHEQEEIQHNDHLYVEAVRWINPRVLRVKIWGHDSDRRTGFERFYRYRVP